MEKISTDKNPTNILTKVYLVSKFRSTLDLLNVGV